jgi:hypothetical protein
MNQFTLEPHSNTTPSTPVASDPSWESFLQDYSMSGQQPPNHGNDITSESDPLRAFMSQSTEQTSVRGTRPDRCTTSTDINDNMNQLQNLAEIASSEPRMQPQQLNNAQLLQAVMSLLHAHNGLYPPGLHPANGQPTASTSYSAQVPQAATFPQIAPQQLNQGNVAPYPNALPPAFPWPSTGGTSNTQPQDIHSQLVRPQETLVTRHTRTASPEPNTRNAADEPRPRRARAASSVSATDGADAEEQRAAIAEEKRKRNTAASGKSNQIRAVDLRSCLSPARFRNKKKSQVLTLERTISDLSSRAEDLEREAADLRRENGWLKEIIILKGKAMTGQTPSLDKGVQETGENASKMAR